MKDFFISWSPSALVDHAGDVDLLVLLRAQPVCSSNKFSAPHGPFVVLLPDGNTVRRNIKGKRVPLSSLTRGLALFCLPLSLSPRSVRYLKSYFCPKFLGVLLG